MFKPKQTHPKWYLRLYPYLWMLCHHPSEVFRGNWGWHYEWENIGAQSEQEAEREYYRWLFRDKEMFSMEELSKIVGVAPHIIRYWETEFPQIKPERDEIGENQYSRKELQVIQRIHYLLFESKYSIADTKIRLAKEFR
jgi:hypothetical protein